MSGNRVLPSVHLDYRGDKHQIVLYGSVVEINHIPEATPQSAQNPIEISYSR